MRTISRKDLFDAAWDRPLTTVAAEFGITSTALKKICTKHRIPTPSRGYWAQVAAGRTFPKPKMLPVSRKDLEVVQINGPPEVPEVAKVAQSAALADIKAAAPDGPGEASTPAEPAAVVAVRKAISRTKPDGDGFISVQGKNLLPMKVSEAAAERALTWLASLIHLVSAQGGRVDQNGDALRLVVNGEPLTVRIEEKPERTLHKPTPAELAEKARRADWGYSASYVPWRKYDNSPSGRLSVMIDENNYSGLRRSFADGKSQSLDKMLPEIVAALAAHAALIADRRVKAEEARREAALEQARRERRKDFEQREERRMKFVDLVAAALEERAKLKGVLDHLEHAGQDHAGPAGMRDWLRRRLLEVDALVSPQFVELSARSAKLEFDEAKSLTASEPAWYYPRAIDLHLWSIDEENDEARAQAPYEWLRDRDLIPAADPREVSSATR